MIKSVPTPSPKKRQMIDHIAIIMDGNGRWARKRKLPRFLGHRQGLKAVREVVRGCANLGVKYLTLFAFSTENWRRPAEEVSFLMNLFLLAVKEEVVELNENNIRLRIIGDKTPFGPTLNAAISEAERVTKKNTRLHLTIAANYGGRWDLVRAINLALEGGKFSGSAKFTEKDLNNSLSISFAPEPDLFIRTGGEQRISNFLLWQMAYTELYFSDELWPDFSENSLKQAVISFRKRKRRFGGVEDASGENETVTQRILE